MLTGFVIGDRGLGASGDTHPAWMMTHAVAGPYLVVGASAIGQIHLARGFPREDAFVIRSVGPWLAVAVADGVGSRPYSRYGATYAVESLTSMLLRPFFSLSKAAQAESASQPPSSDLSGLAPPPTVEEVELKPLDVKKGSGAPALGAELMRWSGKIMKVFTGAESSPLEELPSDAFRQVASIGWWPSHPVAPNPPDEVPSASLRASPQPERVGATVQDQGGAAEKPQPALDEPNLEMIMRQAFEKTHRGLREHARSLGLELADLGCTALALLLHLETGRVVVGQVGDGAILGLTAQGEVEELGKPEDTGDPQSTYTLNRPNFDRHLDIRVIKPAKPYLVFYVMTDGLSGDLLYSPQPEALKDWAQKVDRNLRLSPSLAQAAAGMLNWLATYQVKGSWDDRTLVVITQKERTHGNRQPAAGQPESVLPTGDR